MYKLVTLIDLITLEFKHRLVRMSMIMSENSGAYLAAYVWEIFKNRMDMLLFNTVSMTCYCRDVNKIASFVVYHVVVRDQLVSPSSLGN